MEEKKNENYIPFNREEHTTDNPDYVQNQIKEMYPESQGFRIAFEIVPATGAITARGKYTVIADIYKVNDNKKTL